MTIHIPFQNTYARLPDRFFTRLDPTPVRAPATLAVNRGLAAELGLDPDALASPEGAAILSGARLPEGAEPLAQAYAGHQFGGWVPQLGDGRAILLGEVTDRAGNRQDIQLKGAGPTPYSRMGDGRAGIGPVLREYLVSEAMHALGIPTTRALAATATGEPVYRETVVPGAVLARVAASHVRVGTVQFFAARQDLEGLRLLADHVIARHYPEAAAAETPALALFEGVIARQARLIAQWMGVGFIHGVMNTDNMTLSGETIDYGPCAFMERYVPGQVFSSIDQQGRYAYNNQPQVALWNLAQLGSALLPLIGEGEAAVDTATAALNGFATQYQDAWAEIFCEKLGLADAEPGDVELAQDFLGRMAAGGADFTGAFRGLAEGDPARAFDRPEALDAWLPAWEARVDRAPGGMTEARRLMRARNPALIARNHRVEQAIAAASEGDLNPFHRLAEALRSPYEVPETFADLAAPAAAGEEVRRTFCGT